MAKYVPQVFIAPGPQAEASGQPMMVFCQLAENLRLAAVLEQNGLNHVDAAQWYPMQSALNVFRALYEEPDGPNYDLVAIGMKAMQTLPLASALSAMAIEDLLQTFDQVAKAFSRNVPEDFGFPLRIIDRGRAILTNNTPIPTAAVYGFIWTILNSCKPKDYAVLVRVLSEKADVSTEFEILWGFADEEPLG